MIEEFENLIADYFGSNYAVSVDCCTHGIELCLRLLESNNVECPTKTYLSIPMTFEKLNLSWSFVDKYWEDFYQIGNTPIIDAAVLWKPNSYIHGTYTCLSFQFKKHLNLGRGGMILLDSKQDYHTLKKMRWDGRVDNVLWQDQNIDTMGYHYYMTPETAKLGIEKFHQVKNIAPKLWCSNDYPDLRSMTIFKDKS